MARTLASTAAAPTLSAPRRACVSRRPSATGRRLALAAAGALLALALTAAPARAQNLPFDVRAATITTTAPITEYVKAAAATMLAGDREKVVAARQALLAPLERNRNQSPAFLNAYARELADQLMPVAEAKDPHAKLNAAIVVIRAGEMSHSPVLSPLVAKLSLDDSPAVATFGLRAASQILIYALGNPAVAEKDPLLGAIATAVQENPESDSVVFQAYLSLTDPILQTEMRNAAGPGNVAAATPRIVDAIQNLMDLRLKQYAAGDIVEPAAELQGITLLTRQQTWPECTPAQKTRTVNLVAGLLDGAANQLLAALAGGATQNRSRAEALRNVIKGAAGGLNVVGQQAPANKALVDATAAFKNYGPSTPAADYRAAADKAIAIARAAYPANGGAATAAAPATQPQVP